MLHWAKFHRVLPAIISNLLPTGEILPASRFVPCSQKWKRWNTRFMFVQSLLSNSFRQDCEFLKVRTTRWATWISSKRAQGKKKCVYNKPHAWPIFFISTPLWIVNFFDVLVFKRSSRRFLRICWRWPCSYERRNSVTLEACRGCQCWNCLKPALKLLFCMRCVRNFVSPERTHAWKMWHRIAETEPNTKSKMSSFISLTPQHTRRRCIATVLFLKPSYTRDKNLDMIKVLWQHPDFSAGD